MCHRKLFAFIEVLMELCITFVLDSCALYMCWFLPERVTVAVYGRYFFDQLEHTCVFLSIGKVVAEDD